MRSAILVVAGIAVGLLVVVNGDCSLSSHVWHCQVTDVHIRDSGQEEFRRGRLPSLPAILSSQGRVTNSSPRKPFEICTTPEEGPVVAIVTLSSPPTNAYNSTAPLGLTRLSFLGPSTREQLWTFELLDVVDQGWISAGTNTQLSLVDGWQDIEFGPALPLPAKNYVDEQGEVKIRLTGAAQPWEVLNCADFDDFELQFAGVNPTSEPAPSEPSQLGATISQAGTGARTPDGQGLPETVMPSNHTALPQTLLATSSTPVGIEAGGPDVIPEPKGLTSNADNVGAADARLAEHILPTQPALTLTMPGRMGPSSGLAAGVGIPYEQLAGMPSDQTQMSREHWLPQADPSGGQFMLPSPGGPLEAAPPPAFVAPPPDVVVGLGPKLAPTFEPSEDPHNGARWLGLGPGAGYAVGAPSLPTGIIESARNTAIILPVDGTALPLLSPEPSEGSHDSVSGVASGPSTLVDSLLAPAPLAPVSGPSEPPFGSAAGPEPLRDADLPSGPTADIITGAPPSAEHPPAVLPSADVPLIAAAPMAVPPPPDPLPLVPSLALAVAPGLPAVLALDALADGHAPASTPPVENSFLASGPAAAPLTAEPAVPGLPAARPDPFAQPPTHGFDDGTTSDGLPGVETIASAPGVDSPVPGPADEESVVVIEASAPQEGGLLPERSPPALAPASGDIAVDLWMPPMQEDIAGGSPSILPNDAVAAPGPIGGHESSSRDGAFGTRLVESQGITTGDTALDDLFLSGQEEAMAGAPAPSAVTESEPAFTIPAGEYSVHLPVMSWRVNTFWQPQQVASMWVELPREHQASFAPTPAASSTSANAKDIGEERMPEGRGAGVAGALDGAQDDPHTELASAREGILAHRRREPQQGDPGFVTALSNTGRGPARSVKMVGTEDTSYSSSIPQSSFKGFAPTWAALPDSSLGANAADSGVHPDPPGIWVSDSSGSWDDSDATTIGLVGSAYAPSQISSSTGIRGLSYTASLPSLPKSAPAQPAAAAAEASHEASQGGPVAWGLTPATAASVYDKSLPETADASEVKFVPWVNSMGPSQTDSADISQASDFAPTSWSYPQGALQTPHTTDGGHISQSAARSWATQPPLPRPAVVASGADSQEGDAGPMVWPPAQQEIEATTLGNLGDGTDASGSGSATSWGTTQRQADVYFTPAENAYTWQSGNADDQLPWNPLLQASKTVRPVAPEQAFAEALDASAQVWGLQDSSGASPKKLSSEMDTEAQIMGPQYRTLAWGPTASQEALAIGPKVAPSLLSGTTVLGSPMPAFAATVAGTVSPQMDRSAAQSRAGLAAFPAPLPATLIAALSKTPSAAPPRMSSGGTSAQQMGLDFAPLQTLTTQSGASNGKAPSVAQPSSSLDGQIPVSDAPDAAFPALVPAPVYPIAVPTVGDALLASSSPTDLREVAPPLSAGAPQPMPEHTTIQQAGVITPSVTPTVAVPRATAPAQLVAAPALAYAPFPSVSRGGVAPAGAVLIADYQHRADVPKGPIARQPLPLKSLPPLQSADMAPAALPAKSHTSQTAPLAAGPLGFLGESKPSVGSREFTSDLPDLYNSRVSGRPGTRPAESDLPEPAVESSDDMDEPSTASSDSDGAGASEGIPNDDAPTPEPPKGSSEADTNSAADSRPRRQRNPFQLPPLPRLPQRNPFQLLGLTAPADRPEVVVHAVRPSTHTSNVHMGQEPGRPSRVQVAPRTSWQWVQGMPKPDVNASLYVIDLFGAAAPDSPVEQLTAANRTIICYFSAGTLENHFGNRNLQRPDYVNFTKVNLGKSVQGMRDDAWLDIKDLDRLSSNLKQALSWRIDLAKASGCQGILPMNVDAYSQQLGSLPSNIGFDANYSQQLQFNLFLAEAAHDRGLAVGLHNDGGQVKDLVEDFDLVMVEQCFQYQECGAYAPFVQASKAVLAVEYQPWAKVKQYCRRTSADGISLIKKGGQSADMAGYEITALPWCDCALGCAK